jgi:hypothetical protein
MGQLTRGIAGVLLAAGMALPLAAQAPGMPMHFAPGALRGLKAGVDLRPGRGIDGRALLNLSYLSLGASYGDRKGGPNPWSAALALHLVRDHIRPWSLSLDLAYGDGGARRNGVLVETEDLIGGVALGWNGEGMFGVLVPWAGLRVQRRSLEVGEDTGETRHTGLGVSAGTEVRLNALLPQLGRLGGLSVHIAGDLLRIAEEPGSDPKTRVSYSFGVSYVLSIRVFPERGIIPPPRQLVP